MTEYKTRAVPATDTEGTRVRVTLPTGKITVAYPAGYDPIDAHAQAVLTASPETVIHRVHETPTGFVFASGESAPDGYTFTSDPTEASS